jgi:hypothetical protein
MWIFRSCMIILLYLWCNVLSLLCHQIDSEMHGACSTYGIDEKYCTCTLWRYGPWRTLISLKTDFHSSLLRASTLQPLILIFYDLPPRHQAIAFWAGQHSFFLQVYSYTVFWRPCLLTSFLCDPTISILLSWSLWLCLTLDTAPSVLICPDPPLSYTGP